MTELIGVLLGITVAQFALIWYKVGRMEQKLADLCSQVKRQNK